VAAYYNDRLVSALPVARRLFCPQLGGNLALPGPRIAFNEKTGGVTGRYQKILDGLSSGDVAPVFEFRAHNAPLGMAFLRHQSGDSYQHAVLVALLHGSWNRSSNDGYKVVSLHWNEGNKI